MEDIFIFYLPRNMLTNTAAVSSELSNFSEPFQIEYNAVDLKGRSQNTKSHHCVCLCRFMRLCFE